MKIVLSSNPYRDRGLRVALEARRVLEHAGAQTVLCLPFQPKKGDRLDLPRQVSLSLLDRELATADLLICLAETVRSCMPLGTRRPTESPFLGSIREAWGLWRSWSVVN